MATHPTRVRLTIPTGCCFGPRGIAFRSASFLSSRGPLEHGILHVEDSNHYTKKDRPRSQRRPTANMAPGHHANGGSDHCGWGGCSGTAISSPQPLRSDHRSSRSLPDFIEHTLSALIWSELVAELGPPTRKWSRPAVSLLPTNGPRLRPGTTPAAGHRLPPAFFHQPRLHVLVNVSVLPGWPQRTVLMRVARNTLSPCSNDSSSRASRWLGA
jgi:hypothetical protein